MDEIFGFDGLPELMVPQLVLEFWLATALWAPERLLARPWLPLPSPVT